MSYNINRQYEFIEYAKKFANDLAVNIYLGGSFKKGTATPYSDIDLYLITNDEKTVSTFIYSYDQPPVYISNTTNPMGILIVVYANGVSLDLSVGSAPANEEYNTLFHINGIDMEKFVLNSEIYKNFVLSNRAEYSVARLFHRSLIKYLSGKDTAGIELLKEMGEYLGIDCSGYDNYKELYDFVFNRFLDHYPLPFGLEKELKKLYSEI